MRRVVCLVQARMTSGRLPGKTMALLAGRPALDHVVSRLMASRRIDEVALAIADEPQSAPIEEWGRENAARLPKPLGLFRGPAQDCLGRFIGAARRRPAPIYLRATADNPLVDPEMASVLVDRLEEWECDYVNCGPQLAKGLAVECFWARTLEACCQIPTEKFERESITYPMYSRPRIFTARSADIPGELRRPDYRLTMDTPEDYELFSAIFDNFGPDAARIETAGVLRWLDSRQDLVALNSRIPQRAAQEIDW